MRKLFWLLLLGNVILFALMQRGGLWRDDQLAQAQPALNEEKIRLLDDPQSLSAARSSTSTVHASQNPFGSSLQLSLTISSPVATKTYAPVCLEWGDFSGADLKLATVALSALQLGNKLDNRQVEQIIRYWVYIPPLGSKSTVSEKVAQLKARGVGEYFIVQDAGPWKNAISLGVFSTQEAAQNYLNVLRAKGVRSAKVGERAGKQKATIFILNGVGPATEARLTDMHKDFPGSELKNVPCAH